VTLFTEEYAKTLIAKYVKTEKLSDREYDALVEYVKNGEYGTYRYLIYGVLQWTEAGYGHGMDIGLLDLNNALVFPSDKVTVTVQAEKHTARCPFCGRYNSFPEEIFCSHYVKTTSDGSMVFAREV